MGPQSVNSMAKTGFFTQPVLLYMIQGGQLLLAKLKIHLKWNFQDILFIESELIFGHVPLHLLAFWTISGFILDEINTSASWKDRLPKPDFFNLRLRLRPPNFISENFHLN